MHEWDFPGTIAVGAQGKRARRVQEWLCLQGLNVAIDDDFGPATRAAVKAFQAREGLRASGTVNLSTWTALVAPMTDAVAEIAPGKRTLGQLAVAYARQHLAQQPREIGGENCGPWVRLYMKGHDGVEWPWCAGFVCYLLQQAARTRKVSMPLPYTFSCDSLAASAKELGTFVPGRTRPPPSSLMPGTLFLVRRTAFDWVHTGMVISAERATLTTIEGNTNDTGGREGYEVCRRTRAYDDKDFATVG